MDCGMGVSLSPCHSPPLELLESFKGTWSLLLHSCYYCPLLALLAIAAAAALAAAAAAPWAAEIFRVRLTIFRLGAVG